MRARIDAFLRRLGAAGVVGIGVLLACAGFWFTELKPARDELTAQRAALEKLRARTAYKPVASTSREEELRRFYNLFPPAEELAAEIERLHRLGRAAGLDLAQGEYRLERRPTGLWAYRVSLPVRGTYSQLREFLSALLKDMPIASLDALRFERKKAMDSQLEAQVRVTVHLRPSGETP